MYFKNKDLISFILLIRVIKKYNKLIQSSKQKIKNIILLAKMVYLKNIPSNPSKAVEIKSADNKMIFERIAIVKNFSLSVPNLKLYL